MRVPTNSRTQSIKRQRPEEEGVVSTRGGGCPPCILDGKKHEQLEVMPLHAREPVFGHCRYHQWGG